MKTIIFFIFLTSSATWATSPERCGYKVRKNQVWYCDSLVKGAQGKTWTTLDNGDPANWDTDWGKDKNHAYWRGEKIPNVSPKGFQALNSTYIRDSEKIYVSQEYTYPTDFRELPVKLIEPINTFSNNDYLRIGQNIFYRGRPLAGLDPEKTRIIGFKYATDGKFVFAEDKLMEGIDPNNLSSPFDRQGMISDGKKVFYLQTQLPGVDIESLKHIDGIRYYKDLKRVYTLSNDRFFIPIPQITAIDFHPSTNIDTRKGCGSYSDAEVHGVIFRCDERLMSKEAMIKSLKRAGHKIDTDSFELLETVVASPFEESHQNYYFAKDKNSVYFENLKIEDADPKTFKILKVQTDPGKFKNTLYSADKNNVYFLNQKLEGLNPIKITLVEFAGNGRLIYEGRNFDAGLEKKRDEDYEDFKQRLIRTWYPLFYSQ